MPDSEPGGGLLLCVLLWAIPGRRDGLRAYEDDVLGLLGTHGGRALLRYELDAAIGGPDEVQLIAFGDPSGYESFMADPRRQALAGIRAAVAGRTVVIPVVP